MEETSPRFGIESPRRRGGRGEERKEGDSRDRWSVEKKEGRRARVFAARVISMVSGGNRSSAALNARNE